MGTVSPEEFKHQSNISEIHSTLLIVNSSHSAVGKRVGLGTSSVQVEGSILTAGKRLSLKNLNVIIRAIN